ncbi:MAG: hypothetical protein ACK5MW_10540 [Enterococcus sp.]
MKTEQSKQTNQGVVVSLGETNYICKQDASKVIFDKKRAGQAIVRSNIL